MKKLNEIRKNNKKPEKFEMKDFAFYWIFNGNGDIIQKHNESDYSCFVERNYQSKCNLESNEERGC